MDIDINKFASTHADMTLKEYIQFLKEQREQEIKDIHDKEEKHKQWIIDNLVGKYLLFKMEGNHRIMTLFVNERGDIVPNILYSYSSVDHKLGDINSEIFRFTKETLKSSFRINWIKSPYNSFKPSYIMYIIKDEEFNNIVNSFKSFEVFYKNLLNLNNFTKVE